MIDCPEVTTPQFLAVVIVTEQPGGSEGNDDALIVPCGRGGAKMIGTVAAFLGFIDAPVFPELFATASIEAKQVTALDLAIWLSQVDVFAPNYGR